MMKTLGKTYIFLFLATLMACTEYGDFERRLTTADSLMNHGQADSAFRMLCGMNAEAESMPDALQMRHLLLRSNAQNKVDSLFTSDSIGNVLVEYYDQHGTPNEQMLAHYIKGCAYRDMGDQPATLRCYNDAVAAADTSMTDCNYDQLSIIYGQIARIFRKRAMSDNALQAYEYAERYAWKAKDTIKLLTFWGNRSDAFIDKGETQEALRIKEAVAGEFRRMGYPQYAAQVMGTCIKWYARQGDFNKAKAAMDDYETLSGYFQDNGEVKPGMEDYYHIKGTYYLEKGHLDSAEFFFQKLQAKGKTTNDRYLASWGLSQLYKKTGESDSVAKYAFLNSVQNDSIYNEQTAENLQNAQAMYNYARHQENALRKELETKDIEISRRNWIIAGVLLLSIIVFFWRRQIRLKKSELRTANRKNTQLSTQLHTANEENAQLNTQLDANNLKIAQLNEQISGKGQLIKQLNEVINKNAADLQLNAQLQQTVAILEERLATNLKEKEIHSRTHNLNTLQQQPVVKHFTELANGRVAYPTYKDWHTLYPLVEDFYPQLAVLRKDISDAEYQICVLTKLGFRLSDIGHLMNVSKAYMSTTRKRLSEKLFHTDEGSAKLFDQRIKEL